MTFQIWGGEDGSCMSTKENIANYPAMIEEDWDMLFEFEAESFDEAKIIRDKLMGWE